MLNEAQRQSLIDRFESWELAEFLQVSTEDFLAAADDSDWINEDNIEDLLDYADLREHDD